MACVGSEALRGFPRRLRRSSRISGVPEVFPTLNRHPQEACHGAVDSSDRSALNVLWEVESCQIAPSHSVQLVGSVSVTPGIKLA